MNEMIETHLRFFVEQYNIKREDLTAEVFTMYDFYKIDILLKGEKVIGFNYNSEASCESSSGVIKRENTGLIQKYMKDNNIYKLYLLGL
jgi:hypothetical protein